MERLNELTRERVGLKRASVMVVALLLMALTTVATPQATYAAGTDIFNCYIPGTGGDAYCDGNYLVQPGEYIRFCLNDVTYPEYPGGFYVRNVVGGGVLGSAEFYKGNCKTLWTNNTGQAVETYLTIDSRSFGYQMQFVGTIAWE